MSTPTRRTDALEGGALASAIKFNARQGQLLRWAGHIPPGAADVYSGFASSEPEELARAVFRFQADEGTLDVDGMLGSATWRALLARFDPVGGEDAYVVVRGRRVVLPPSKAYTLRAFDQAGGLDLHTGGGFRPWSKRPERTFKRIVLHWGGSTAEGCQAALLNRGFSSHFGVDRGRVFNWLDLGHEAWHAGWANTDAIGVDICQQPTVSHLDAYRRAGLDVCAIHNPAHRPDGSRVGDAGVLTLDTKTAAAVRALVHDLCDAFAIPFSIVRAGDGSASHALMTKAECLAYRGILAHSNVSARKWDVAPWLDQLFPAGA